MKKIKICVATGTRAEYGLLRPLLYRLEARSEFELVILITGMHLSFEFGNTYKVIENDGFKNIEKVEMLLSSDTRIGIVKSMGLGMICYSEILSKINPNYTLVLGDRYEIYSLCSVAVTLKIPIIHLHGGEITEGAYDDCFRHCITKMSYLHFTSTEDYRKRVIQLGEDPSRVFNVGAIGIENIKELEKIDKKYFKTKIKEKILDNFFIVLFHPVTLEDNTAENQTKELLKAIEKTQINVVFISGNSDSSGAIINKMFNEFVSKNIEKYCIFKSIVSDEYLNLLRYSNGLIGNSSSGIIETPSLNIGSLNIGDRQKGRIFAKSTIHCLPLEKEIIKGIAILKSKEFKESIKNISSPYGKGVVSENIIRKILETKQINLKKSFYNLNIGEKI